MAKTLPIEAELEKAFGQVKVRLFDDGKNYTVLFDTEDFESLLHKRGDVIRKVTTLK